MTKINDDSYVFRVFTTRDTFSHRVTGPEVVTLEPEDGLRNGKYTRRETGESGP